MAIIRLESACLAYGDQPLLADVTLAVEQGDRIAVIGRNGAGKSSFMKVLSQVEKLDSGQLTLQSGITTSYLDQTLPAADDTTVFDYLASGLASLGQLLQDYMHLSSYAETPAQLTELQRLQDAIEAQGGWDFQQRIEAKLTELSLGSGTLMKSLSGGWRKRLSIVRAMIQSPELLLLDEPTNHLDIPAIEWLEQQIKRFSGALLLISHDRRFLSTLCQKIYWLDRGQLRQFNHGYAQFLEQKAHTLSVEATQNALFDKKLAEEEKWIRQGIKARRTRNEGRVRALKALRTERANRLEQKGNVAMQIDVTEKSGKKVAELDHVGFSYANKTIINDADFLVQRGDKIGIVGENGVGKTTLVKLILGELTPSEGQVSLGTNLQVAYFDQNRAQLNLDLSVADNLAEGREFIDIKGKSKHVISYLGDFLFAPQRVRSPVSTLSGGERNRLLLAKLFSKPANVLVLDEPSNDLDIETLELLEELISDYQGTVLVISHDREFIDQIVTSTLFIDRAGRVFDYVGGFDDLERQHGHLWHQPEKIKTTSTKAAALKPKKRSYKVERELEQLPLLIEQKEADITAVEAQMAEPSFFQQPHDLIKEKTEQLANLQAELASLYKRWEEIEAD